MCLRRCDQEEQVKRKAEVNAQYCVVPTVTERGISSVRLGRETGSKAKSPGDFLFTKWAHVHEACRDKIAAHAY